MVDHQQLVGIRRKELRTILFLSFPWRFLHNDSDITVGGVDSNRRIIIVEEEGMNIYLFSFYIIDVPSPESSEVRRFL